MTGGEGPEPPSEGPDRADGDVVEVRLLQVPVRAFLDLQEALDGYQRELQLARQAPLAAEDAHILVSRRRAVDASRTALHDQASAALRAGRERADLLVRYPLSARDDLLAIMGASQRADEAARSGGFLEPPPSDEVRALQTWIHREVIAQLDGHDPRPHRPRS